MVAFNSNGDLCDIYRNIYLDPGMILPHHNNFNLSADSPCIDAGDTALFDPDGTIRDIGALFYNHLTVNLSLHNPTTIIPGRGGSFGFDITVENEHSEPLPLDIWTEALLPGGNIYGPILSRFDFLIPASTAYQRIIIQYVPGTAPAGFYYYYAKVGFHPDTVLDSDEITFMKLLGGDGVDNIDDSWAYYGWSDSQKFSILNSQFLILNSSPNPFNASTALSFKLQAAGNVSLAIYDIAGREVTVLAEGWYPTGSYQFTWDASSMASGVYFARLTAGGEDKAVKMLLVK